MTQELRIRLFGGCHISLEENPVDSLLVKQEALLAYLAMSRQEHTRTAVAALLWGGKSDSDALRNLRVNLATLSPELKSHLQIGRQTMGLDVNGRYWLDVEAFETYLARSRQPNGRLNHALLHEAIALYRGDFMAEFDAGDAEEFEEWLAAQRLRLQAQYIQALDTLVEHAIDQENYDVGIGYAQRLLSIEPWREETHQQMMWLLALDGQFSAALTQYDKCGEMLTEIFGKGPTAETEQLYRDILHMRDQQGRGLTRPLPPLPEPTAPKLPFQAPRPPDNFLGREAEIDHLWQKMAGSRRLLISGMGGVGKSSLAQQLAHTLRGEFPDGVLWANAANSDPMQIADQWATAYGYDFSGIADLDNRAAALRHLLAEKKALLIFDDLVEAARIRSLLPTAGECVAIITTRNAHLALALDAEAVPLRELTAGNGLKLLTRLIGQERVEGELGEVTAVCDHLQNLPLALTIAGRYLALRPRRKLADFAERVRDQAQRLQALALDDLAVRVSFLISWQALDDTQKEIFRWLGVFNGRSFTAAACAAVAELQPYPTQDRLYALVMLSLLHEDADNRYRQHPLLADFAREQLGDDPAAYSRMAHYFRRYAEQHASDYAKLQPEWENLSAGIATAHHLHQWQDVIATTHALQPAWFARGRYSEARQACAWAYEGSLAIEDEQALGNTQLMRGLACLEQSDYEESEQYLRQSLQIFEQLTNETGMATAQYALARIANDQGNHEQASQWLATCLQIRERLKDVKGIAEVLHRQARVNYRNSNYQHAFDLAQKALALQESIEDKIGMVRTLGFLADLIMEWLGDDDRAESLAQRALTIAYQLNDKGELAVSLEAIAEICRRRGNYELARRYALESLESLTIMGDKRSQSLLYFRLSRIYEAEDELHKALTAVEKSFHLCQEIHDKMGQMYGLVQMGLLRQRLLQGDLAKGLWQEGLSIAKHLEHAKVIAKITEYLATT